MRIYLDNCCYGRPYDEQSSQQIIAETQSMRLIRKKIENGKLELATSFMLHYEINQRKDVDKKNNIDKFIKTYRTLYVGIEHIARLDILASKIMATGIKTQDSYHVASAILAYAPNRDVKGRSTVCSLDKKRETCRSSSCRKMS